MTPAQQQTVRVAQILVFALLVGVIGLAVVAHLIGPLNSPPPAPVGAAAAPPGPFGGLDPLIMVMAMLMIGQIPVLGFLGFGLARQAAGMASRLADEPEARDRALAGLWLNGTILRAALAEGVGLFGGVILLLTGDRLAFIGIGFAVLVLIALIPTRGRLESWIQRAVNAAALFSSRGLARP